MTQVNNINAPATMTNLRSNAGMQALFGGTAGQRLMASGWQPEALRPVAPDGVHSDGSINVNAAQDALAINATLRRDEWMYFDNTVTQIARERLTIVQELMSRGLTWDLPNALGVLAIEWDKVGDLEPAQMTMSGLDEALKDQLDYGSDSMPVPMIHKEFTMNLRQLEAARRNGRQMDSTHAAVATRKVADLVEQLIFTGATISSANGRIWGLLNHPHRTTGSIGSSWASDSGENIITDILAMIEDARLNNMFGPFLLFIPGAWGVSLSRDYKANSSDTILDRIMKITGILAVIPTNRLTAGNVLLVQASSDVIQLINGMQPTLLQWDSRGGFEINFKVVAIMLPRIRSDYAEQSGIVHYS